jgi:hypothetical protein
MAPLRQRAPAAREARRYGVSAQSAALLRYYAFTQRAMSAATLMFSSS